MLVIQNTIQKLSSPLSDIINLSLFSGIVPDQLKVSRVIPLFKSGNKSYFSNYRPVSVLQRFQRSLKKFSTIAFLITYLNLIFYVIINMGFEKAIPPHLP